MTGSTKYMDLQNRTEAQELLQKILPERWTPLRDHRVQSRLFPDPSSIRFRVTSAGRRSGKTENAKRFLALEAMRNPGHRYFIAAPIRPQAEAIYWLDMLALLKGCYHESGISKTKLSITLINGAYIQLFGLGGAGANSDAPARLEGTPCHGGIIDEYAKCPANVFEENIRPMLAEFQGWCWFVGKPVGRNHHYDMHLRGLDPHFPDWRSYTWPSGDILPAEEIEAARREMDPRTFRQEFEGSFESYEGLLYYCFEDRMIQELPDDPRLRLNLSCDFNKAPLIWNVYQLPYRQNHQCLDAINEIHIPVNAKTPHAAQMFIDMYGGRQFKSVKITGDAANNYEGTHDHQTDYTIMNRVFEGAGWDIEWAVPDANPGINNRVNVGNSLMSSDRFRIDPKCVMLIRDFHRNESDNKGAKDKSDKLQTHASDNFDYEIWSEFSADFYDAGMVQY